MKSLRRTGIAIACCVLTLGSVPTAPAAERFQMALFFNSDPAFGDLEWVELPRLRPGVSPGKRSNGQSDNGRDGILLINSVLEQFRAWAGPDPQVIQTIVKHLTRQDYDWSRVKAVLVDEPFWSVTSPGTANPCEADARKSARFLDMEHMQHYLANIAAAVRQVAPRTTRFWVNFSRPEILWMREGNCPFRLNDWYMDVVSLDWYEVPFIGAVKPHYDWLFANRPTAYQQLALIPGTFRVHGRKVVNSATAASWVQQYFDYAAQMNASCTLPLGRIGVTGNFDGCPVWLVAGFWGDDNAHSDRGDGTHWVSLRDSTSSEIRQVWAKQLRIPRKKRVD